MCLSKHFFHDGCILSGLTFLRTVLTTALGKFSAAFVVSSGLSRILGFKLV